MHYRNSVGLVILIFVALAPFFPLPVGHGSFTSVNGANTALREYRAALQLMRAVTLIAILTRAYPPAGFDRMGSELDTEPVLPVVDTPPFSPVLRC